MLLESYDLVTITETSWHKSRDWTAAINGHRLVRRHRRGMNGEGIALCIKKLRAASHTKGQEGTAQVVEAGTGVLGRV